MWAEQCMGIGQVTECSACAMNEWIDGYGMIGMIGMTAEEACSRGAACSDVRPATRQGSGRSALLCAVIYL
jgi:hypothetical protein